MTQKTPRLLLRRERSRPEEESVSRESLSPPGFTPDDDYVMPKPNESPAVILPSNEPPAASVREPSPLTNAIDETSTNTVSEDLWCRAYTALLKQEPELVKDYECHIGARSDETQTLESRQTALSSPQAVRDVVTALLEERQNKQLKFSVKSKDYKVRDQLENLVKLLSFADGIVKQAVSTQPYAALAWSAASVFLPVCETP